MMYSDGKFDGRKISDAVDIEKQEARMNQSLVNRSSSGSDLKQLANFCPPRKRAKQNLPIEGQKYLPGMIQLLDDHSGEPRNHKIVIDDNGEFVVLGDADRHVARYATLDALLERFPNSAKLEYIDGPYAGKSLHDAQAAVEGACQGQSSASIDPMWETPLNQTQYDIIAQIRAQYSTMRGRYESRNVVGAARQLYVEAIAAHEQFNTGADRLPSDSTRLDGMGRY
jgi:hypothetical protein